MALCSSFKQNTVYIQILNMGCPFFARRNGSTSTQLHPEVRNRIIGPLFTPLTFSHYEPVAKFLNDDDDGIGI